MNLHAIVRGAITTVNPDISVTWRASTGYTNDAAGKQTPAYASDVPIQAQVQALTTDDLAHVEMLNLQGIFRTVYMYGNKQGIVRPEARGGDILLFPQVPAGTVETWLIVKVPETWPDWCHVIACLQL